MHLIIKFANLYNGFFIRILRNNHIKLVLVVAGLVRLLLAVGIQVQVLRQLADLGNQH